MPDDTYVDLSRLCAEVETAAVQVRRSHEQPSRQQLYLQALRGAFGDLDALLTPSTPEAVAS